DVYKRQILNQAYNDGKIINAITNNKAKGALKRRRQSKIFRILSASKAPPVFKQFTLSLIHI
ncbi:hypothetical protein LKL48_15950, partial [Listeria monocytogenes]